MVVADGGDPSARLKALAQRVAAAQVIVHGFPFAGLVDDGVAAFAGFVAAALAGQRNGHALAQSEVGLRKKGQRRVVAAQRHVGIDAQVAIQRFRGDARAVSTGGQRGVDVHMPRGLQGQRVGAIPFKRGVDGHVAACADQRDVGRGQALDNRIRAERGTASLGCRGDAHIVGGDRPHAGLPGCTAGVDFNTRLDDYGVALHRHRTAGHRRATVGGKYSADVDVSRLTSIQNDGSACSVE
ncbi:hypothetical protein D3C71_1261940 [compost metagenome]